MNTRHVSVRSGLIFALISLHGVTAWAQTWRDSLELTFENGNGNTMPYRLFVPPGHDQPGAEYPLVLFLHRGAFLGDDNRLQVSDHISGLIRATQGDRFPAFLLAPQTPEPWWYESVRELPMQIVESIEQQYQIDSDRIYVAGTSLGGSGVNDNVSRNPNRFAAALPMSSGLLPDPNEYDYGEFLPESFPETDFDVMSHTPFWVFHGAEDELIPSQWSRDLVAALEAAGGDVQYTELPGGANHSGIWSGIFRDREDSLYPWLFAQSRSDFDFHGDFNRNHIFDPSDIDLLTNMILAEDNEDRFDLNRDEAVNRDDHRYWVDNVAATYVGDSNLDGEFNSTDFVQVFQAAEYEDGIVSNSTWSTGDWNGDGEFDSADLVVAFQEAGYERGPRALTHAVPEPNSIWQILIGVALVANRAKQRSRHAVSVGQS